VIDTTVFARHLDLTPLHGRRRGLVRCRFHSDKTPSLSVDLERGLFCCFGCGTQGGLQRFAALVGEIAPSRPRSGRPRSDYDIALERFLSVDRVAAARRAEWLPFWLVNDHIRRCGTTVAEARRWAQVLGPDHAKTWDLLARAATVETEAYIIEAALDALLEEGRIG
jgi:hypothetical protein